MELLVAMLICKVFLVFGTALTLAEGHGNQGIEQKAGLQVSLLLETFEEKVEPESIAFTSHNILLEVHDAITEPNKLLSYEKTVVAHHKVKNYVLTTAGKPIELRPKAERPMLKAVK
ncbi:hypothetical protein CBQ28_04550 [Pseudoalteromonas sp. GCY]|uniref:hypothetical protein n=1 Tax=Pseudoalteromonas TaxID=53246 RepID=UPI000BFECC5F|nr:MULTISPECIES: hypothetical protein [Pseudoalteromonas]MDP4487295.1 hypothetical protein [Pseudoalteromonas piscicida]PHI38355.1 hypothetical protein CBQ28_04550 [Pseudoalteromonas sp. GCY]QQQ65670.1 hypothetical protein JJQ94_15270 [Pseudoalteromonas sp. GCY]RZG05534.1 hypothetical protein EXT48_08345 [Pseudoalteromonas sp. CO348]